MSQPPAASSRPGASWEYDAFISYRHIEPDRGLAKWLHTSLESYRVPRRLVEERGIAPRIQRVFRDEEELAASSDLKREIESALQKSRFLIVICSPRTPSSEWVNKEVLRFRQWNRNDRILALLIEGEPAKSFPRSLCEIRRALVAGDPRAGVTVEEVEPLAADVRPRHGESVSHLRRMALLRILATLLGCKFDELRQREQERQNRRMMFAGAVLTVLVLLMSGLALYAFAQKVEADWQRGVAVQKAEDEEKARKVAEEAQKKEKLAKEDAFRNKYISDVNGAFREWQIGNVGKAEEILLACPENLRSWEWHYLMRLCHGETQTINLNGHVPGRLAFSRDGAYFAASLSNNKAKRYFIQVWDAKGQHKWNLAHPDFVTDMQFSPDGGRMTTGCSDGTVRVWDLATGKTTTAIPTAHGKKEGKSEPQSVRAVDFLPDGKRLCSRGENGQVKLWDAENGNPLATLEATGDVTAVCPARGRVALTKTLERTLTVVDPATGATVMRAEKLPSLTGRVEFSPDGKLVAWSGNNGLVRLWEVSTGGQVLSFQPHKASISALVFTSDGKHLITGSADRTVKFWNLETGREALTFRGHAKDIRDVALHPGGKTLATASDDETIKLWDPTAPLEQRTLPGNQGTPSRLLFSPDGTTLAAEGNLSHIDREKGFTRTTDLTFWDASTGQPQKRAEVPGKAYVRLAFSPDGTRFVGEADPEDVELARESQPDRAGWVRSVLHTYDLRAGKEILPARELRREYGVGLSPDARTWVTATAYDLTLHATNAVAEWSFPKGMRLVLYQPGEMGRLTVTTYVFSDLPKAREIMSKDTVGTVYFNGKQGDRAAFLSIPEGFRHEVRLTDLTTGKTTNTGVTHGWGVASAAFSPDGRRIATAGLDGVVKVLDAGTGREVHSLDAHPGGAYGVGFSRDGARLATAGKDGTVKTWAVTDGKLQATLAGYEAKGTRPVLEFSPDGARLACHGDYDAVAQLWNVETGEMLLPAKRESKEERPVATEDRWAAFSLDGKRVATSRHPVAFSPDGNLLTGSTTRFNQTDPDVRLWDTATGRQVFALYGPRGDEEVVTGKVEGGEFVKIKDNETIRIWNATPLPVR